MSGPDQLFAKPRIRPRACLWVQMLILLVRPGSSDESPEGGVVDDHHAHARDEVRRGGVVWLAYATAGRHLIRLAVPAVAVFLPIGLLAASALILLVDGSAGVVNSDFELIGAPGTSLLVWSAATLVLSAAGQAVALPATVVLATGRLVGKGVSTSDAMRAAARRWPAMALLILVGVVAFAVALAAGFGILMWTGAQVTAYAVMAVLTLSAMPCLLAVAPMVLEGRSARGALARAYWVTAGASWATPLTLAFGVVLFPALAAKAVNWAVSGLPIAPAVAGYLLALVTVPFQATVIARLFLHRLGIKGTITEFEKIVDGLPASTPRRARRGPVLAALLLPGLLYGGAVLINPLGWLEVSETAVTENWPRDPDFEVSKDERPKPELDRSDLQALHAGPGGSMVMLMDGSGEAKLLTCMDSSCARTRFTWAEPVDVAGGYAAASARLTDGRLVVSTWALERVDEDELRRDPEKWRARLGLLICDATGCVPAPGGKPITEVTQTNQHGTVALAARPGGGLVVAQLHELPWSKRDVDEEGLSITTCDDPACTRPRTKELAKLPADRYRFDRRGLVAGVGPDDRPVMMRFDRDTGSIFVISCDDSACAKARVGQPVWEVSPDYSGRAHRDDTAMVVRADGLPLIAYRDVSDGAIRLLDCRTRECSRADTARLSEPGHNTGLAMVLDRDGRALVAYQDLDRERIVIAACTRTRCTRTPVTTIRRGGDDGLAMALDGHGRPMIAWMDAWNGWDLVVTTPLNLP
ncbi:hypothetical protein [Nonomuraea aurantiaca]|uniref:hypothetical protein n=1 Tax=Nonomuraea aurantiaca TaxID=2878562 RepID=UPI001CD93929|nr:hypothetical protein [Nonomuraea aurantiaca]MCA2228200.1 hypothetical protein [Nonomuraea aurantiaca]